MTNNSKNNNVSLINGLWINDWKYNMGILSAMMAMEILMAYSPFGYIILPKISITTLFLGVMAAALWGGPLSGAMVGLVFGLTSIWKASVTATNPNDLIFSPVKSGNPLGSIILALAPRILFGIIAGLVYYLIMKGIPRKAKIRMPVLMLASVVLERVHSMLTYLFMDNVFHVEGASMSKAWTKLFSANRIRTYLIVMLIIACAYLLYDHFLSTKYYEQFSQTRDIDSIFNLKYIAMSLVAIAVVTITATHLWEHIKIVLFDIDDFQPELTNVGLIEQVIFQFVAAAFAALYVVFLIFKHARNVDEIERAKVIVQLDLEKERAERMELSSLKDPLTGVYNRKGMERVVAEEHLDSIPAGFLLIDIDHFKEINDNFGHDAGDTILNKTAKMLVEFFGENRVFRLGGDEFAVLIGDGQPYPQKRIQEKWDAMTDYFEKMHLLLSDLLAKDAPVTFSAGVCFSETGYDEKMYPLADRALYATKKYGRGGCTLVDQNGSVQARWKDPKVKSRKLLDELNNIGICRLEFSQTGSRKPMMFCGEDARSVLCVPKEASPEKCYEIWSAGLSADEIAGFEAARESMLKTGMASYSYIWNHPLRGSVRVESCGSGKLANGTLSVICHYQLFMDEGAKCGEGEEHEKR